MLSSFIRGQSDRAPRERKTVLSKKEDFVISGGTLKEYHGNANVVIIPDGVTRIGKDVFYNDENIESIQITDTVTSIGESAFGFVKGCIVYLFRRVYQASGEKRS